MKDLTSFLVPNLVIGHHGTEFVVSPPSKDDGLLLTAIHAAGIAAFSAAGGDVADSLTDTQRKLLDAAKDRDLGEVSLGDAYAEMVAAGIPGPHIDQYALYAMYYWVLGEDVADQIIAARYGQGDGNPKDHPEPSKNGPSSE